MYRHLLDNLSVAQADILAFPCDVLVLKHAQSFMGADSAVMTALRANTREPQAAVNAPAPGEHVLLATEGAIAARFVLLIGVNYLSNFGYAEIREFACRALTILANEMPGVTHIAMTVHGVGFGLDEREAFMAQIGGLLDATKSGDVRALLARISVVERNADRTERLGLILKDTLAQLEPDHTPGALPAQSASLVVDAGAKSDLKPHVFVAMPYSEDMEDVYIFGIQGPVNSAGLLCERVDMTTFTGNVLERIKSRIETAVLTIADLTGDNANVYLEVGYAWGRGRPTLLLARRGQELKFDVRGQRILLYKNISDLAKKLECDLSQLPPE